MPSHILESIRDSVHSWCKGKLTPGACQWKRLELGRAPIRLDSLSYTPRYLSIDGSNYGFC